MTDRHTTIRASQLRNFSITAEDLKDNSITGAKLIDGTISGAKLVIGTVVESSLDIANDPIDGYYLKYTTVSGMEWSTVSGGSGGGTSDHGALTGLEDDDHSQYSLVDGTRAFTGTVSGVTPTEDAHLATKLYVDDEITSATGSLTTDHGELTGLADDDHTQYLLTNGTREGTGDLTISGSVTIYNNKRFHVQDTTGTSRRVAYLSDTDQMIYGDTNISQNYYRSLDDHVFQTYTGGVTTRMLISQAVGVQLYDDVTISTGHTLTIGSAGTLESGQDSPTGSGVLGYNGYFYATRVYNAVYNDIADFQELTDELVYGKCYYDTLEGARICNIRCQKSVIGIASDTYGFGVGKQEGSAPFAIAGWVLANVDQEYEPGDVLTNDNNGNLTLMIDEEKCKFPERIVAIYKKKEKEKFWGPNNEIEVKDRHWVKVK